MFAKIKILVLCVLLESRILTLRPFKIIRRQNCESSTTGRVGNIYKIINNKKKKTSNLNPSLKRKDDDDDELLVGRAKRSIGDRRKIYTLAYYLQNTFNRNIN